MIREFGHRYKSLGRSRQMLLTILLLWMSMQIGNALFEHGPEAADTELTSERSVLINLSPSFPFYGLNLSSLVVYRDAFICFDDTPRDIYMLDKDSTVNFPAVTSWASEIRTGNNSGTGTVTYRLTTNDTVLDQLSELARMFSDFSRTFYPYYVLVVTWQAVGTVHWDGEFRNRTDTFQTLLSSDGIESLVLMDYVQVEWIYDGSGVFYDDGGTMDSAEFIRAQVGFYKGDGQAKYLLPSSFTSDIRHINRQSNINKPGLYIFRVDRTPENVTAYTTTTSTTGISTTIKKKTPTSTARLLTLSSTSFSHEKGVVSEPIIGLSVACMTLVLITVLAFILICQLHKNKRIRRLKNGRVVPESSTTNSKQIGTHVAPNSLELKQARYHLHSARSVAIPAAIHVLQY